MIHGFTCAGMLPTQFIKMSRFAGIGTVKHGYIKQGGQEGGGSLTRIILPLPSL